MRPLSRHKIAFSNSRSVVRQSSFVTMCSSLLTFDVDYLKKVNNNTKTLMSAVLASGIGRTIHKTEVFFTYSGP